MRAGTRLERSFKNLIRRRLLRTRFATMGFYGFSMVIYGFPTGILWVLENRVLG